MATELQTTTATRAGVGAGGSNLGTNVSMGRKPVPPVQVVGFVPLYTCDSSECRIQSNNDCCEKNIVFGNVQPGRGGVPTADINSNYENDWSTFLVDFALYGSNPAATATWTLQKCVRGNPDVVDIEGEKTWINSVSLNQQLYGAWFALGSIAAHPTYTGIYINWGKILKARGAGLYRVKLQTSLRGLTTCQVSDEFYLRQFDCNLATSTVKFEARITGQIGAHFPQGKIFDLCDLSWYDSIRLPGWFGFEKKPEYLQVLLEEQNGTQRQIRNEVVQQWLFQSKLWPKPYHDRLSVYMMMADSRLVSDYNINNSDYTIKQIGVIPAGPYEPEYFDADHNRKQRVTVEFKAGQQSIIKSVCCPTKGGRG